MIYLNYWSTGVDSAFSVNKPFILEFIMTICYAGEGMGA